MDTTIKVTSIHIVAALVAAFLSGGLTLGWFGFKNDIFAGFIALIILYFIASTFSFFWGLFDWRSRIIAVLLFYFSTCKSWRNKVFYWSTLLRLVFGSNGPDCTCNLPVQFISQSSTYII